MNLLFIIAVIVLFLASLLFIVPLRIIFNLNTDKEKIALDMLWLYPLLKAAVVNEDAVLTLTVYLLGLKIYKRVLKSGNGKSGRMDFVRQVELTDIRVQGSYGFKDPFVTGIACGILNMASQFTDTGVLNCSPDFAAGSDYIRIKGTANLNMGSVLAERIRSYRANSRKPASYQTR
ncbi:MAG: hypothetical protein QHH06_13705 [Clostridiales bacterium]|nr:hypothetical protein [Eubacteriales bacterium]MDH7567497.1 hypothetical protein [Clostridiales bacterium]